MLNHLQPRENVYDELKRRLNSDIWKFTKTIKDNTLLLCGCEVDYSTDKYVSFRHSELQERVCELLNAVFEIRKKLFDE